MARRKGIIRGLTASSRDENRGSGQSNLSEIVVVECFGYTTKILDSVQLDEVSRRGYSGNGCVLLNALQQFWLHLIFVYCPRAKSLLQSDLNVFLGNPRMLT